jgi:phospholipid-binding lipoprotein MlaA
MRSAGIRTLVTALALFTLAAAAPQVAADSDTGEAEIAVVEPAAAESDAADSSGEPEQGFEIVGPGDPWEGFNRKIFWFNDKLDLYLLRPVAVGWDFVLPDLVQTGIRNVFQNARFPIIFLNDLLQAKPVEAGQDLGRFVVNTTVGIGGLWDPAKRIGLTGNNEDFGQTLGYWGVPPGPFLVLPILGASNPRDTVGLAADAATMVHPYFLVWYISAAITTTNLINTRARYIEEIDENRASALDFYAFQRNAYMALRENLVNDYQPSADPQDDDLYYFEDEEEDDPAAGTAVEAGEEPVAGETPVADEAGETPAQGEAGEDSEAGGEANANE